MKLKDIIAADIDDVFFDTDEFGKRMTFEGKEIIVIADVGEGLRHGRVVERGSSGYFSVKKSDIPNPRPHHVIFDSSGKKWHVQEIAEENEASFVLWVTTEKSAVILKR